MNSKTDRVVLFDGVCNYCNWMINFVIRQDRHKKICFAPLQSNAGQRLLEQYGLSKEKFDSFVFIEDGKASMQSTAALKLMNNLPWYWKWTLVFWIVPKPLRDAAYNFVARRRYQWFGKRESCMIPTPDVKSRFLN